MRKVLVTAAAFKPLEVDIIKARPEIRGLVGDDDNLLVADNLESAIAAYEEYTNNVLCSSEWDLYLDRFPRHHGDIETPGPLASVDSIKYQDSADTQKEISSSYYVVDTTNPLAGRISLAYGQCWEVAYDEINAVVVRFIAGYANQNSIPRLIKDGLIAKIQELFSGVDMSGVYEDNWFNYRRRPI
jgi:uncharacterized phiE125 gp8 family phage protein